MKDDKAINSLRIGILLTFIFFVVEIFGGYISGSLSLLSDAGHMFRDILALILTLTAISMAGKLPTHKRTFGYHRVEILAAFINGILLFLISIWILFEAYERIRNPRNVNGPIMFAVAFVGLIVNSYVALRLHGSHDLNIRSAFYHVITDTLSSVAVIIAAIIIFFTGFNIVDPILSIIIGIFIIITSFGLVRDSVYILLQFTPRDVDLPRLIEDVESIEGVDSIHEIHLWSLCSHVNVMDAHIYSKIMDLNEIEEIKLKIKDKLIKYDIKHVTLEFECTECAGSGTISQIHH
jgi:cobalt-zinc-cadmium efflux system protein